MANSLITYPSGSVAPGAVSSAELGYLDGVTSAIQTQLDGKASLTASNVFTLRQKAPSFQAQALVNAANPVYDFFLTDDALHQRQAQFGFDDPTSLSQRFGYIMVGDLFTTAEHANDSIGLHFAIRTGQAGANVTSFWRNGNVGIGYQLYASDGGPYRVSHKLAVDGKGIFTGELSTLTIMGVGLAGAAPSAALHVIKTTEQARLGYDATNYLSTTIASTGSTTFELTGTSPTFTFGKAVSITGGLAISGTITSGTYNGTKIAEAYGGTNQSTYALGDVLYSSATNTLSKLGGNITTAKQYLSQTGNGSISAAPAWATIAQADITSLVTDLAAKQPNVQYKDEGTNIGSAGGVTTINYTGDGITATYASNTVTVDVPYYNLQTINIYSDFYQANTAAGGMADLTVSISSGTATIGTGLNNRPGILALATGTSATGRAAVSTSTTAFQVGNGAWTYETDLRVPTLSTAGERFMFMWGLGSIQSAANQTNGIYFVYDEGGVGSSSAASANWQIVTAQASTRTYATTGNVVNANQWYRLKVVVNAAATSVSFYVDGAEVTGSPITTNIPSTAGQSVGLQANILKSIGTTARSAEIDWMRLNTTFTTTR